jgi:hypothetical protein
MLLIDDVVDSGFGPGFRFPNLCTVFSNFNRNPRLGIIEITKNPDFAYTGFETSRLPALIDPLNTVSAFVDYLAFFVHVPGIVRTCQHAVLAADALLIIDDYDAVFVGLGCTGRTHSLAMGVVTVVALSGIKIQAQVWIGTSDFTLMYPVPVFPQGNMVFRLTGDHAGLAVYAPRRIYEHAEFLFPAQLLSPPPVFTVLLPWLLS